MEKWRDRKLFYLVEKKNGRIENRFYKFTHMLLLEKDGQLKEKRQTNNQKLKIKDNHPSLLKKKNHAT